MPFIRKWLRQKDEKAIIKFFPGTVRAGIFLRLQSTKSFSKCFSSDTFTESEALILSLSVKLYSTISLPFVYDTDLSLIVDEYVVPKCVSVTSFYFSIKQCFKFFNCTLG